MKKISFGSTRARASILRDGKKREILAVTLWHLMTIILQPRAGSVVNIAHFAE
jgi:hypothetical protein